MFKDAIKEIAYDRKVWEEVDDEDRMYLYSEFIKTKDGLEYINDCFSGEGNESKIKDLIIMMFGIKGIPSDDTLEDLSALIFSIADEYLNEIMFHNFNDAFAQVELDMEIEFLENIDLGE